MALLKLQNFDQISAFAEDPDLSPEHATYLSLSTSQKRSGYQSCRSQFHNYQLFYQLGQNLVSGVIGIALYPAEGGLETPPSAGYSWIYTRDGEISKLNYCITGSGGFEVYRSNTLIARSEKSGWIKLFQWNFVEIKFKISNSISAGDCEIRVNGITALTLPAGTDTLDAGNAYINRFDISGLYNNLTTYYDDIYVCDLTGTVNNDFLGPITIETLYPSGNGTNSDFVGSDVDSTDNYLHVDENPNDGDTSYVESSTIAERDSYALDNLSGTPVTVHAVVVKSVNKKDDSGTRTGKLTVRSGAAEYDGAEFTPLETYIVSQYLLEEDPATSAAWIAAGINALEAGIMVQT